MSDYEAFLRQKFDFHRDYGFDVDPADLSPCLLPHQRDIVRWAIKGGRRALFESFGLGKSVQQLEILRLIHQREQGRCLIVCPLGVRQEFTRDARQLLGVELNPEYFTDAVRYLQSEEARQEVPSLFDLIEAEAEFVGAEGPA